MVALAAAWGAFLVLAGTLIAGFIYLSTSVAFHWWEVPLAIVFFIGVMSLDAIIKPPR